MTAKPNGADRLSHTSNSPLCMGMAVMHFFASLVPFFSFLSPSCTSASFCFFPFRMRPGKFISGYRPCQPCAGTEGDRVWREIRALYYQTPGRIRKYTPSSHGPSTLGAVFAWYSRHFPAVHDPARVVRRAKVPYAAASSQHCSICTAYAPRSTEVPVLCTTSPMVARHQ